MHTCHIIIVEAETAEKAYEAISDLPEDYYEWSDWSCVGEKDLNYAGRYDGSVFGSYKDGVYVPSEENHLRYSDDPALAEQVIEKFLEYRMQEIRSLKASAIDLTSVSYDPYVDKHGLVGYQTRKLAQILNGDWTPDTYIYDANLCSSYLGDFIERVKTKPEKLWLVAVDFHF